MVCEKCNATLTSRETSFGKCTYCLVKGYKFALGMRAGEIKALEKKVELLRHKMDNANMIIEAKNRMIANLEMELDSVDEDVIYQP
jgi:predicted RNase H-like nuclease (RuvC/YqgF family)